MTKSKIEALIDRLSQYTTRDEPLLDCEDNLVFSADEIKELLAAFYGAYNIVSFTKNTKSLKRWTLDG